MPRHTHATFATLLIALIGLAPVAYAQRGAGEERGIAQRADKPEVNAFQGELTALKIEPCKHTTGRFDIGMHAMIDTRDGRRNVHLGPAAMVLPLAQRLPFGQSLTIEAFRTDRLPEGHRIAQVIRFNDQSVRFRAESLRPVWAGAGRRQAAPPLARQDHWRGQGRNRAGVRWGRRGRQHRQYLPEGRPHDDRPARGYRDWEDRRKWSSMRPRQRGGVQRGRGWDRDWRGPRMHRGWRVHPAPRGQRPMMQRPDRAMRNQLKELRGAVEDLSERLERLEAEE